VTTGPANPCTWPVDTACVDVSGIDPAVWEKCVEVATMMLWSQTGRRFGTCPRIVRPCRRVCASVGWGLGWGPQWAGWGGGYFNPTIMNGSWINMVCGGSCADDCSCTYTQALDLPGPVDSVTAVWQDGVRLDPSAYKVMGKESLYRLDGKGWPFCQRLDLPLTAVGTLGVEYAYGEPVPAGGDMMTAILARELTRACANGECRIPGRVTQVSRDGMTYTLDPTLLYKMGLTGIPEVDQWIATVNPGGHRRPPYIRFPGDRRPGVQTWPTETGMP